MKYEELEKRYKKSINKLKRQRNYYKKTGHDVTALDALIDQLTGVTDLEIKTKSGKIKKIDIKTKTGKIKKEVLDIAEEIRAKSLIDVEKKEKEFKEKIKKMARETQSAEKVKQEQKQERQKQINKQKAKIRMAIEVKIESTLNKIKEADPHTEVGQPLYNKIKEIYTNYTDVKTKDVVIDKIIRNLQQQFGEEGLKKGYRIWGQYGVKKIEEAYIKMERYNKLDDDAKTTISKMPLPVVKGCYETVYCDNKKDAYKEDWESGQVYFVHLLTVKNEKLKNGKTRKVEVYAQSYYLKNVDAIKYLTIKGKDSSESYDATRDYNEVVELLGTFYI